ncbi:acyl-CoA thioesterase [Antribacter gilvus]|uniref:acyl-CoA thioesterase n=1 Tax=Antribacter gilvus TaxID=2304675 RepID=UPI000F793808|nr:acyl-CoA thioesterase [Antribacter gilvus]
MTRMLHLTWASLVPRRKVPGRGILDASVTRMRVLPADLDYYLHVNNGAYLQMMDVARSNMLADLGAFPLAREKGWLPVVAASTVKYRRSLQLWERFEITTRVIGWDARVFYMEQVFTRRGDLCARGIVAGRFLDRTGNRIAPQDVIELFAGEPVESPALPDDVVAWARAFDVAPREPSTR